MSVAARLAEGYVGWLRRHRLAVVLGAGLAFVMALYLISARLPLRADVAYLLPEKARSVRDLHAIERRVALYDTMAVLVHAPDADRRAAAATAIAAGLRRVDAALVREVRDDDSAARAYIRARLHQYVPIAQLAKGRDALLALRSELLIRAMPRFAARDDDDLAADGARRKAELDELRARWREIRDRLTHSIYVSGEVQRVMVRIAFDRTDTRRAAALMREVDRLRAEVGAMHPGVRIGVAGGVAVSVAEHDALVRGMTLSGVVTALLVGLVLIGFLRSLRLVVMAGVTLAVSTTVAFGVAAITVGQLNAATAFLGAIIAGNGVNYGILLLARYQEERAREPAAAALAIAIHGTVRPTLVASLAATVAYGSLALTSFRGFADFALIGGVGMLVCWVGSFVLLPALILRFDRRAPPPARTPLFGATLARLFGFGRPAVALTLAAVVAVASTVIVVRYVAADPLEYDLRRLRSDGAAAHEARRWMAVADQAFGPGLINRSVIAVDDAAQVPRLVETLRDLEAAVPAPDRLIGEVRSILAVVPAD
jgi:uncharacterized protein